MQERASNRSADHLLRPSLHKLPRFDDGTNPRSWDAVVDTEENQHQWLYADGRSINQVLVDHYEQIAFRSVTEARRNPTVEGVIKSHAGDVVGDQGPRVQLQTDDDAWNTRAEEIWKEVANEIDAAGTLSLGEWLRQDMYQSWVTGDMLCQVVDDPDAETFVKTRVHPISPLRLKSPFLGSKDDIMLGVQRNKFGRPKKYFIEDEIRSEYGHKSLTLTPVPARDMLHWFESMEPGQVRGCPRLAGCLQAISDLREYDNAVLDAAKVQAMMSVLMYWAQEDMGEASETPADVKLKRMGITRIPVGWKAAPMQTSQPNSNNTDFRDERTRELGRASSMPLMQIRLDSSDHNYSSARFDGQLYHRANVNIQGSLGRHRVKPVVRTVLLEAMRRGMLMPRILTADDVALRWQQPPHVDPVKEALAERIRLENKTLSPQMAADAHNLDFERVVKDWRLANEVLEKNNLPPLLGGIPTDLVKLMTYLNQEEGGENANQGTTQTSS